MKWRIRRDLARGDIERAIEGVRTVLRLSGDLRPRGNDLSQISSIAMDQICYNEMVVPILSSPGITSEHCERVMALVNEHEHAPNLFLETIRRGYLVTKKALHDAEHRTGKVDPDIADVLDVSGLSFFPWKGSGRPKDLEERHKQIEQYLATVDFERERDALDRWYSEAARLPDATLSGREQRIAEIVQTIERDKLLIAAFLPDLDNLRQHAVRLQAYTGGTKCLAALRRWQLEKSTAPRDLAEVVRAAGMDGIPTDPFSGQPLQMTNINGEPVIYSVAMDGKDDQGRVDVWNSPQRGKGDLLFRVKANP